MVSVLLFTLYLIVLVHLLRNVLPHWSGLKTAEKMLVFLWISPFIAIVLFIIGGYAITRVARYTGYKTKRLLRIS